MLKGRYYIDKRHTQYLKPITALSGAFSQISAGRLKKALFSRVPRRCICGHMWTLNSLLTETCFSWYSVRGRKRDLCHGPKQTTMKPPPTLVHGALHKTHVPCSVYWSFLESLFLPPGQVSGKKRPLLAGNNLNGIDKKKKLVFYWTILIELLFWYRIPSVFFLWK